MTARLPQVGGDDNDWGAILNSFLEVSHDAQGNLLPGAVSAALPSPIPTANLGSGTASSSNFLRGDGVWAVPAGGGSGTVTSVAVASANGFAGTVANSSTTPAITLETTVTGLLKGNGAAVSAATAGTDYLVPNGSGSQLTGITISQVSGAAPLASPALTGTPTAPTPTAADNSTKLATTAYADNAATTAASGKISKSGDTMIGELSPKVVTLTQSGGSVAVNASLGNVFRIVLTASGWTIANPTGYTDGQPIRLRLIQDSTGGRTVSWGSAWNFGTAGAPTLSTGASKVDYVVGEWSSDANNGTGAVAVSAALGY